MIAGLDLGSTLTKAAWMKDDKFNFASTAEKPLEEILAGMKRDGIKKLNVAGIGYEKLKEKLAGFEVDYGTTGTIIREVTLQANGARKLLEYDSIKLEDFLLVSVGTGVSYTAVTKDAAQKAIWGNYHGGGYLLGISKMFGYYNYEIFSRLASQGNSLNLKIKDMVGGDENTFFGEVIIAVLGKIEKEYRNEDINASFVEDAAASIILDILKMGEGFNSINNVYVGSTIRHTPLLKDYLQKYSAMIGKNAYFPNFGEFALALGAYYEWIQTEEDSK